MFKSFISASMSSG
ncbi:hypothetical protein D049_3966A, partial [Vibrio parahaemolyticus VPTS-2010]